MRYKGQREGHSASRFKPVDLLQMDDGSLWQMSPSDKNKSLLWVDSDSISVADNVSVHFPYRLVNTNTRDTVEARYLGTLVL